MPLTRRYILPLILCCLALPIQSQQPAEEDEANIRFAQEIHAQLDKMNTELHQIAEEETRQGQITPSGIRSAYFIRNMNSKVQSTDRRLKAFNVRWEAFNAANQAFISDHEDLMDKMGLIRGAVTPLGILANDEKDVVVYIDKDFENKLMGIHPCDNTATVYINTRDVVKLIKKHGNELHFVKM